MTPDEIRRHEIEKRNAESKLRTDGGPGSGPRGGKGGSKNWSPENEQHAENAAHVANHMSGLANQSGSGHDHGMAVIAHSTAAHLFSSIGDHYRAEGHQKAAETHAEKAD